MANPPEKTRNPGAIIAAPCSCRPTDFPMKAGLPEAEPRWLARWAAMDLYGKIRSHARAGAVHSA